MCVKETREKREVKRERERKKKKMKRERPKADEESALEKRHPREV